jgi:arylsulfatase A-like enzyme
LEEDGKVYAKNIRIIKEDHTPEQALYRYWLGEDIYDDLVLGGDPYGLRRKVEIDHHVKNVLFAPPPTRLSFSARVPKDGRLSFSYGILVSSRFTREKKPVVFEIAVKDGESTGVIFSKKIDPSPYNSRWFDRENVSLERFENQDVTVQLSTHGGGDSIYPLWGEPVLYGSVDKKDRPHIVFIAVDTLRADHLSSYGYGRRTSPQTDSLGRDGIVFKQAISQAPWTLPSFASIFTSLYPSQHKTGLNYMGMGKRIYNPRAYGIYLDETHTTLPELLNKHGYFTGGLSENPWLNSHFGLAQGYSEYYNHYLKTDPDKVTTEAAIRWIKTHHDTPFFLFIHNFAPHLSYQPPKGFEGMFASYPSDAVTAFEELYRGFDPSYRKLPERKEFVDSLTEQMKNYMIAQYDGEIAYADSLVGRIIQTLKELNIYDETLVVFTSDHGEELFEHGKLGHGYSLYDEVVHIPLIIKLPSQKHKGKVIRQQVRSIDIMPTMLDYLGIPVPETPPVEGRSLRGLIETTPEELLDLPAYMEAPEYTFPQKGLRTEEYKYIFSPTERDYEEFFHLSTDPFELNNRVETPEHEIQETDLKRKMAAILHQLEEWEGKYSAMTSSSKSTQHLKRSGVEALKSLGYVQ